MAQFLQPLTSTSNTPTRYSLKPNHHFSLTKMALALRFTLSPTAVRPKPSLSCSGAHQIAAGSSSVAARSWSVRLTGATVQSKGRNGGFVARSSLEAVTVTVGKVTEVDKDTFWPIVKAAGEKTVVLDMYTQWCGPCKVMAPKFQELSEKYLDVVFLKLDCNQDNKPLAKELGIRVVPTFKILKDGEVVKEVTGAKFDNLLLAIDAVRSS